MLISRNAHSGSIPLRHSEGVTYSLAGTRFSGVGQSAPWGAFCSPELGLHGPRGGSCCARVLVASPQKWVALRHPTLDCPASPAEVDAAPLGVGRAVAGAAAVTNVASSESTARRRSSGLSSQNIAARSRNAARNSA